MKIFRWILEGKSDPEGTFVGARLSDESAKKIVKFIKDNNIPDPVDKKDLHVTLIYSRKYLPKFKPRKQLEDDDIMLAEPTGFDLYGEEKHALVIELSSPDLHDRHNQIMKEHKATYDFDVYKPHLTLSYECVGFDASSLQLGDLGPLEFSYEYEEELKLG